MKVFRILLVSCLLSALSAFSSPSQEGAVFADSLSRSPEEFENYYRSPLNVEPLSISGSYGEFRSNHFHSGLDMRIGGVEGAPVYAVADGYVSRIGVSSGGYGNALYITHPNHTVSVYGHMQKFAPAIRKYVEQRQYESESFLQSLYLPDTLFRVKKGQFIGNAGNSGGSGGPHLHFEIRDKESEIPLNLLRYDIFHMQDSVAPLIRNVQFWAFTRRGEIPYAAKIYGADMRRDGAEVAVPDTFYLAVGATDRMQGTHAKLAIARWEVLLDDTLLYAYTNGDVSFDNTRHINALIQYSERLEHGRSLLKTYLEPGNELRDFITAPTGGLISLPHDTARHTLRVRVYDEVGNKADKTFFVRRGGKGVPEWPIDTVLREKYRQVLHWDRANTFAAEGIRIHFPKGALYDNALLEVEHLKDGSWAIRPEHLALQKDMQVRIAVPHLAACTDSLQRSQTCFVSPDGKGSAAYIGGFLSGDSLHVGTTSLGLFAVGTDVTPPVITCKLKPGQDIRGRDEIGITIRDDFSGISSYRAEIDGAWVLAAYDAKYSRLHVMLSARHITKGCKHQIVLTVTDGRGNTSTYKNHFLW